MDGSYLANPAVFLLKVLFGAYSLVVLLRFLLQLFRADFYNPISQFVVKVTTPVLHPLRRVIPSIAGLDIASLILLWLLKTIEIFLIQLILGKGAMFIAASLWAVPELLSLVINLFLIAIFIQVILSWVGPGGYNPAIGLLHSLTEPLLAPARRLLPPIGGLDLSPMLVMVGLVLLEMLLIPPLKSLLTGLLI